MQATIFQQLIEAIQLSQGGKVNLRQIVSPLSGNTELQEEFRKDAFGDPEGMSIIETAFKNCGLDMSVEFPNFIADDLPYRTESTEGAPAVTVEVPPGATAEEIAALAASLTGNNE